jgi:hypothetical protein
MNKVHRGHGEGRFGSYSTTFGILAFVCVFVPIVGDFIAIPLAILAVLLGFKAIWGAETERSRQAANAVVGVVAGALVLTWIGIGVMIPQPG